MPSPVRSYTSTAGRTCREARRPASLSSKRGEQLQRDDQRHGLAGISVAPRASCCRTKLVTLPGRPPWSWTMALRLSARAAPRSRLDRRNAIARHDREASSHPRGDVPRRRRSCTGPIGNGRAVPAGGLRLKAEALERLPLICGSDRLLQLLCWPKGNLLAGGYLHCLSSRRIASCARLTLANLKRSKATNSDAVSLLQVACHALHHSSEQILR